MCTRYLSSYFKRVFNQKSKQELLPSNPNIECPRRVPQESAPGACSLCTAFVIKPTVEVCDCAETKISHTRSPKHNGNVLLSLLECEQIFSVCLMVKAVPPPPRSLPPTVPSPPVVLSYGLKRKHSRILVVIESNTNRFSYLIVQASLQKSARLTWVNDVDITLSNVNVIYGSHSHYTFILTSKSEEKEERKTKKT